jgi:site-specific DNA recombinase
MDTRKFFIYVRKSTDDKSRQIRSIEDQVAELRELAIREKLDVVEKFEEKRTAKMPGRPIFNDMLDRIEKGEADAILSWHPNRLARNPIDAGRILWLIDTGKIKDLRFPNVQFENTAAGKFMLGMMFSESKHYVDNLSETIKRGQGRKLRDGIWPLMTPLGYLNDRDARVIVPDPERAPLVRRLFDIYATGNYTLDQLTMAANEMGLMIRPTKKYPAGPVSRSHLHRMLRNPIYTGTFRYGGEMYEGKHEPIITRSLFDEVQAVMTRKSKPKSPTLKPYLYRGFLRCGECGCFVTTETQKGHNYLHCTKRVKKDCSQGYLREDAFTLQLHRYIQRLALSIGWPDWMLGELEKEQKEDKTAGASAENAVRDRIKEDDDRLGRLLTAYLDKDISAEEYREAKVTIIDSKKQKEEELNTLERHRSGWFEPAIRFVNDLKLAENLASSHDAAKKLEFVKTTGSNFRLVNRELVSLPRDAWQLVVDQGSFAQQNVAAGISAATFLGETHHDAEKRRGRDSNPGYEFDPV